MMKQSQGIRDGICRFRAELPPEVTNIVPELALLEPTPTEFLVKTAATQ